MDSAYTYTTTVNPSVLTSGLGAFFGIIMLMMLAVVVFVVICLWRVFVKAGKPGWAALIPIYNTIVLLDIIGKPWWWVFALFLAAIPTIGYVLAIAFGVIVALELARKFGKSTVFGVVALWLFAPVGYAMLAFGNSTYDRNAEPVTTFLSGTGSDVLAQSPVATATDPGQVSSVDQTTTVDSDSTNQLPPAA